MRGAENPVVNRLHVACDFLRGECGVKHRLHSAAQSASRASRFGDSRVSFHFSRRFAVRPPREFPAIETRGDESGVKVVDVSHCSVWRVAVSWPARVVSKKQRGDFLAKRGNSTSEKTSTFAASFL